MKRIIFSWPLWLVRLLLPLLKLWARNEVKKDTPSYIATPDWCRALASSNGPAMVDWLRNFEQEEQK